MFGRRKYSSDEEVAETVPAAAPSRTLSSSDRTLTDDNHHGAIHLSKAQIKRATRVRFGWALFSSFCLLVSVVFIILVEVGNTQVGNIVNKIYFLKIDVSDIIPVSVPDATLINSIAQTLGLHDFYTVGLWGFCQGYNGQGVTECSKPETLYWFNPVDILQSQLLAGATIALPAQINTILDLIHIISNVMFGLFLAGACLNFLLIFIVPLSIYSRWSNLPIAILVFIGALLTAGASIVATVMFIIFQVAITSATDLNIKANIGIEMFVFMWIAAVAAIVAWLTHMGMCCCCATRRDVRTGRKRGSGKAYREGNLRDTAGVAVEEKPVKEKKRRALPTFGRTPRE